MKKRLYAKEIAKKALEVTAAGALGGGPRFIFTLQKMVSMRADYISNGEFDLYNEGFHFGKLIVEFNSFKNIENHYRQHIDKLPDPRTNILQYIASGDLVLKNADSREYAILWENYFYMTGQHRSVDEIRKMSFERGNIGKALFALSGKGQLLNEPAYTTRDASRKTKKKSKKKKK
jgi:hypothetical protein